MTSPALVSPEKARALAGAATSGPWRWFGDTSSHLVYLATVDRGRQYVMRFLRWGMSGATPTFASPESHMMEKAEQSAVFEVAPDATSKADPRLYRHDFQGLRNPDAELIEAAPLLAVTAAVQGERVEAAKALHAANEHGDCVTCRTSAGWHVEYPCPTARALGVDPEPDARPVHFDRSRLSRWPETACRLDVGGGQSVRLTRERAEVTCEDCIERDRHGHVIPRRDGAKAKCGGPGHCKVCTAEAAEQAGAEQSRG